MRVKHNLWRVSNGWLLVPEDHDGVVSAKNAPDISVFKSLKEFADTYPKRERKRSRVTKPTPTKEPEHANQP
jgi:hypothetical protein